MEEKTFRCYNKHIEECVIPDGYTKIEVYTFENSSTITSIAIPNSVTNIGEGAFYHCTNLKSVTIPNSVTKIGNFVFRYCYNIASITIPNSVTSIGQGAFSGCHEISSIDTTESHAKCGYKGFNVRDGVLKCRDFTYEVGKSYHEDNIKCCEHGFHFCTDILDVFYYYYGEYGKDFVICEVEGSGEFDIERGQTNSKICTSDLKVIRQLSREEVIDAINESFKNYKRN